MQEKEWDYDQKDRKRSIRLSRSKRLSNQEDFRDKPGKKDKRKGNANYLRFWNIELEDL